MRQSRFMRTVKSLVAILLFTPFSLIAGCAYLLADENSFDELPLSGWISERTGHWLGSENTGEQKSDIAAAASNEDALALSENSVTLAPEGYANAATQ